MNFISEGRTSDSPWIEMIWQGRADRDFSKTLKQVEWKNSTVLKGDIGEAITNLKQQPGSNLLLFGGTSTAQTFVKLGLIDEYRLLIHPVVLGDGQPLWKEVTSRRTLKLVQASTFRSGVAVLSYQPVKE